MIGKGRLLAAGTCLLAIGPAPASAQAGRPGNRAVLSDGRITVVVNDAGVLVGVPASGIRTFDGREILLEPPSAEWSGVSYDGPRGHVEVVGSGKRADWSGGRSAFRPVSFAAGPTEIEAVSLAGDLEVRTRLHFDPDGPYLLANVTLTNVGLSTIRNIYYTREWSSSTNESWTFPDDMGVPLPLASGIRRRAWMFGDMPPGASVGAGFSYVLPRDMPGSPSTPALGPALDVPLALWTSAAWPAPVGLILGSTNGVSWGDYDADGYIDIFSLQGGRLMRNLGGQDWLLAANLASLLPFAARRYGSSFGDYDEDGLPDIGCEPRRGFGGDSCHHLLRGLGGGPNFVDVATDPLIMDLQACGSHAETICWGDTDGDGDLDFFLPVYPSFHFGGPGNFFWDNLGPTGPGGAHRFREMVVAAGLDNPPGTSRPEGAQFLDTDFDGDLELYSNGTLYLNVSTPGAPLFLPSDTAGSGIQFRNSLEEGIVFHDVDMDGDFDLTGVWSNGSIGVRIHEALGDGAYALLPASVVDSSSTGLDLGISSEDWDNDGDMDLTTRQVFRRNQFVETGQVHFTVATHAIPGSHLTSATPAWGDWDKDGDLDCALGNWLSQGHFYENTLYDATVPEDQRRNVRVRVMRDSATVPAGLEIEYGAVVEVHVAGEENGPRRRKFVSSSGGYLNQNEYTLHFGLPADPDPADPDSDLTFDLTVDLPGAPQNGFLRIDEHVNPVLGGIELAELADREIVVFRSGKVVLDGCTYDPLPSRSIILRTTTDGLIRAQPTVSIPGLTPAAGADHYVGIELDTLLATDPIRVKEILVDGQLDASVTCGSDPANVRLWDVTDATNPFVVSGGALDVSTSPSNRRSYFRANMVLQPGRVFRLVARVTQLRDTPVAAPVVSGVVTVTGGISFSDPAPCGGASVVAAAADPTRVYLALRFSEDVSTPFVDLGNGTAGAGGIPILTGSGSLVEGSPASLNVSGAATLAPATLAIGLSTDCRTLFAGTVIPALDVLIDGFTTSGAGTLSIPGQWPSPLAHGTTLYFQVAILDFGAPGGVAFTNGLAGSTQP